MNTKELKLYSCEYLMDTSMKNEPFVVDKMIYPGLYIFAGSPKIGKSWLMLDLCMSVAEGREFLKHETSKGQVLYLALEDSLLRLQNRLYELSDEPAENLEFARLADSIGEGLEEQLGNAKKRLPQMKLIVIDTLQKIRESTDISYGSDYKELSALKKLADKLKAAIVLVHHTRKSHDNDPFNMISGTTGLSGCVDGLYVLSETKRGSRKGKLSGVGRDIENIELNVEFENYKWLVQDDVKPYERDIFPFAIHDLMVDEIRFVGSATALCSLLKRRYDKVFYPNRVTRNLVQHKSKLSGLGVSFESKRSHGSRTIILDYNRSGDGSDGSLLCSEVTDFTGTRSAESLADTLINVGDGNFFGAENSGSG